VQEIEKAINLVLITDDQGRAAILRGMMEKFGINGVIRRIDPGENAIHCARKSGSYREKSLPDLIFFDFTDPDEKSIAVLREIAFGDARARVPVVLLTSSDSLDLLDNGSVGDATAIMFSPTSLPSFVGKMTNGKRCAFFRALNTLYQYGPILVRLPETARRYDHGPMALSA
jgi:response regulator RpfG family c-di-GMP phosphodiesterase